MAVGAAVGAGVIMALTGLTTGDWSAETMISAGVSGAIIGATSVLGASLATHGAIGLGLAVGALGGMSSYVSVAATKSAIPGGAYGRMSLGGLAWSGLIGMASVGTSAALTRLFTPAGSSESYMPSTGNLLKDFSADVLPGELSKRMAAGVIGGSVSAGLRALGAWGQKEFEGFMPLSNLNSLPAFNG